MDVRFGKGESGLWMRLSIPRSTHEHEVPTEACPECIVITANVETAERLTELRSLLAQGLASDVLRAWSEYRSE